MSWCPPCKMLAPILNEYSTEYAGQIKIVKVDVDEEQYVAARYRIQGVPTLMFFQTGEIFTQVTGVPQIRELCAMFAKLAASHKKSD